MNKLLFAVAFAASFTAAVAQEGDSADAASEVAAVKKAAPQSAFMTLPLCRMAEGVVKVCKPGGEWTDAEEGKFYPLGTSYRTGKNSRLVLAFGQDSSVVIEEKSEIGTRAQKLGDKTRTVVLVGGSIELKLANNLPEGAFVVSAPGFVVKNPAGESKLTYADKGDGDAVTVRCVTGSLSIDGRHFTVPAMRSANEIIIRTSHDQLSTFLYGRSGDYIVKIDQGLCNRDDIGDDGQVKKVVEPRFLDWHLSPATKVAINRAVPAVGERMSVHTMAFDAAGERKSECYFCEGRAEINSGELVKADRSEADEQAKRAAETTETSAATDAEETSAEENNSSESTNN